MPPDESLDRVDRILGVDHRLPLGSLAHHSLSVLIEGNDGRAKTPAFGGRNHRRRSALHDCNDRIRGAEVDTYDLSHCCVSPLPSAGGVPEMPWAAPANFPRSIPGPRKNRVNASYKRHLKVLRPMMTS
jgi:hypothetical protein